MLIRWMLVPILAALFPLAAMACGGQEAAEPSPTSASAGTLAPVVQPTLEPAVDNSPTALPIRPTAEPMAPAATLTPATTVAGTPTPGPHPPSPTAAPTPAPAPTATRVPVPTPTFAPTVSRVPMVKVPRQACPLEGHSVLAAQNDAMALPVSDAPTLTKTNIFIDGSGDDWAGRPVLLDDPAGNGKLGILDLTKGYAFVNQDALYLLVEADDPDAVFSQFNIELQLGPKRFQVAWAPRWNQGSVADITGRWEPVGNSIYSSFAFGPALETRIDLRDLGSPESVKLIGVHVRAGECCEQGVWRIADRWTPYIPTPLLDRPDLYPRIDGLSDDWAQPVLSKDPAGDARNGFLDLTDGQVFISEGALHLFVDAFDADAPFNLFQVILQADSQRLEVAWSPKWAYANVNDVTNQWTNLRSANLSEFAYSSGLEARISLTDLGLPETVNLIEILVRPGSCCEPEQWNPADRWEAYAGTPIVNESDPAWRLAPIGGAGEAERLLSAPDTRAISLEYNGETGRVSVTGEAGAVPAGSSLLVGTTELNDFVLLDADPSGAFTTEVAAAPGTHVLIKQDVTGRMHPLKLGMSDNDMIAPGVMLRVPVEPSSTGIAFGAGARMCCGNELSAPWTIEGTFELDTLSPGERFDIAGRVAVLTDSSALPASTRLRFWAYLIADAEGRQVGRSGKFITPFLAPTGLPVELTFGGPPLGQIWLGRADLTWELEDSRWVADFATTVQVPADIRPGYMD